MQIIVLKIHLHLVLAHPVAYNLSFRSYENVSGDEASPSVSGEGMMTTLDLIKWSYQIALGMEYLAIKKVHTNFRKSA